MKKIFAFFICMVVAFNMQCYAQERPKFTYKDSNGCVFEFQLESMSRKEVVLVSARNKKNPTLEIPSTVTDNGITYSVVRAMSESLKKCDKKMRFLSFPNSMHTIDSHIFGNTMHLLGGFWGAARGGKGGPLSKIRLEGLKIPINIRKIGSDAFQTGQVHYTEDIRLSAYIVELPANILPWDASDYGLNERDVKDYWQRTDPSKVDAQAYAQLKYNTLKKIAQRPELDRAKTLNLFNSYDAVSQSVAKAQLSSAAKKGITREEYIAALQGHVDYNIEYEQSPILEPQPSECGTQVPTQPAITFQDIENGLYSLSDIVRQIPESEEDSFKQLIEMLTTDEERRNYKNAVKTVTQMTTYTSDPLLLYVRAICLYKNGDNRKCMKDCDKASQDVRLSAEYSSNIMALRGLAYDRYVTKLDRVTTVADVVGNSVSQTLNTAANNRSASTSATSAATSSTASGGSEGTEINSLRTNASSSTSEERDDSSSRKQQVKCSHCTNGRVLEERSISVATFGLKIKKQTCSECGESYDAYSYSHHHKNCTYCHGSGYVMK